ncbi:SDR family NAD(P)-dependent oxidoreductase [Algoriphagus mannitolivorans]|uniref:SDR family NAD(P)-dependent oxidoreductase n=1 Tax=Algoriphagus mannitolivorans TaxID=226504 RepID=UPI00047BF742|nr:SDR family NAD(P)-dependent oxidoreductase [Algoriphagus mannitolivorans]
MTKTLLILTGHSKGLGKAILEEFLNLENVKILAISRSTLGLDREDLQEISLDLSDLDTLESKLPELFPQGDFENIILINNAGWIGEIKPVGKLEPKTIQQAIQLNLVSPMILTDTFVKAYGDSVATKIIVNISSGAAHKPLPGWAEYCTSKAGLAMFSKVAAEELKLKGIKVYSLAPGIVDTAMQADIREARAEDFPALERFLNYKTEAQLSTPEEVAGKILYLVSNPEKFEEVIQDVRNFSVG